MSFIFPEERNSVKTVVNIRLLYHTSVALQLSLEGRFAQIRGLVLRFFKPSQFLSVRLKVRGLRIRNPVASYQTRQKLMPPVAPLYGAYHVNR